MCRCKLLPFPTDGESVWKISKHWFWRDLRDFSTIIDENAAAAHGPMFWNEHLNQNGFSEVEWTANTAKFRRKCVGTALYSIINEAGLSESREQKQKYLSPLKECLESRVLLLLITGRNICLLVLSRGLGAFFGSPPNLPTWPLSCWSSSQ